jgi:hypothetical protein
MSSRAETLLRSNLGAADQLGQTVGLGIGALTRLGENNPVLDDKGNPVIGDDGKPKTEHPSFGQAYQEARQQEADPAWKIKNAQAQSQTWANVARATETWQTYRLKGDEAKSQTEDIGPFTDWANALKNAPNTPMPEFKSVKYQQFADTLSRQSQQADLGKQKLKFQQQKEQQFTQYDNQFAALSPEDQHAIMTLDSPDGRKRDAYGYILDDNDQRVMIDPRAKTVIDSARAKKDQTAFGAPKADERQAQIEQKAKADAGLLAQRGAQNTALDTQRFKERQELQAAQVAAKNQIAKDAQQYRIDLEKVKASLHATKPGEFISEQKFALRMGNQVRTSVTSNWKKSTQGEMTNDKLESEIERVLHNMYLAFPQGAKEADQPLPKATEQTPSWFKGDTGATAPSQVGRFLVTPE